LTHLNLLEGKVPNHAAVLLFGKNPQRFLVTSEIKCMHFHTLTKRKPIPSYQIYKGTLFDLVDQSVDFVLSKLNRMVGTRALGPEAPVEYDIPKEVVSEGIVNAVAHRDYFSNASVEVQLYPDRLEIWNPGTLPSTLTMASLRKAHASQPRNPLIAEPLFLTKYIEKAGTGTVEMMERCRAVGTRIPDFRIEDGFFIITIWRKFSEAPARVTGQVTGQVSVEVDRLISVLKGQMTRKELQEVLHLKSRANFEERYLKPAIEEGLVAPTVTNKPKSRLQKYQLTVTGHNYNKSSPVTGRGKVG
jgi:predicted HTH transcriptional regulator